MPQEREATDGLTNALSASLLKHFGTARPGRPVMHVGVGSDVADAGVG